MSRLLKDCMNPCCCKEKDKDICEVIDDLGKLIEGINCAKKTNKENDKKKKETDKSINDLKKELLCLINKVSNEKWVIGEYKWMPVGSKMPEGWVKVNIGEGQTLVQGSKAGKTEGAVKAHSHFFPYEFGVWGLHKVIYAKGQFGNDDNIIFPYVNNALEEAAVLFNTAEYGGNLDDKQKENLAAGTYAELWQFKGVDFVRKCLTKCLENSLAESIEKCMKEMGECQ